MSASPVGPEPLTAPVAPATLRFGMKEHPVTRLTHRAVLDGARRPCSGMGGAVRGVAPAGAGSAGAAQVPREWSIG